jgi:hypothetical protein
MDHSHVSTHHLPTGLQTMALKQTSSRLLSMRANAVKADRGAEFEIVTNE